MLIHESRCLTCRLDGRASLARSDITGSGEIVSCTRKAMMQSFSFCTFIFIYLFFFWFPSDFRGFREAHCYLLWVKGIDKFIFSSLTIIQMGTMILGLSPGRKMSSFANVEKRICEVTKVVCFGSNLLL